MRQLARELTSPASSSCSADAQLSQPARAGPGDKRACPARSPSGTSAGGSVASESVAGESVAGGSVAGGSVASESVASESVASESVAEAPFAGGSTTAGSAADNWDAGGCDAGRCDAGGWDAGGSVTDVPVAGRSQLAHCRMWRSAAPRMSSSWRPPAQESMSPVESPVPWPGAGTARGHGPGPGRTSSGAADIKLTSQARLTRHSPGSYANTNMLAIPADISGQRSSDAAGSRAMAGAAEVRGAPVRAPAALSTKGQLRRGINRSYPTAPRRRLPGAGIYGTGTPALAPRHWHPHPGTRTPALALSPFQPDLGAASPVPGGAAMGCFCATLS